MVTTSEERFLNIFGWVLTGISIFSIIFSLLIYSLGKSRDAVLFRVEIILWLMVFTLFDSCSAFIPIDSFSAVNGEPGNLCIIQSILNTLFGYANSIFAALVGYIAFVNVIKPEHVENHKCRYRLICLSTATGIPASLAIV